MTLILPNIPQAYVVFQVYFRPNLLEQAFANWSLYMTMPLSEIYVNWQI